MMNKWVYQSKDKIEIWHDGDDDMACGWWKMAWLHVDVGCVTRDFSFAAN